MLSEVAKARGMQRTQILTGPDCHFRTHRQWLRDLIEQDAGREVPDYPTLYPQRDTFPVACYSGVLDVIMVQRGENGTAAFPGKSRNRDDFARSPNVSGPLSLGS